MDGRAFRGGDMGALWAGILRWDLMRVLIECGCIAIIFVAAAVVDLSSDE